MLIKIGFSGTRQGMTGVQMQAVYGYLGQVLTVNDWDSPLIEWHHGDCAGADAQSHVIAVVRRCRTVAHPPVKTVLRAWCPADEVREPRDYLARDWDIVSETGELIAAPKSADPDHSGTWMTIGYAVQLGRPAKVVLPDGRWMLGSDLGLRSGARR